MSAEVTPAAAPLAAEVRQDGAYRWYVLGLLFVISIMNMMDRTMVAALAEPLKAEFHLSDSQFGFLAGLVYAVSYTVCGIPIGLLMDRVNRARLVACLVFIWGGATMLLGAVTSFPGLVLARMGVAGAESGGVPASLSILTDCFPPEKRASAIGIYYSGSGVAAFAAFALAGWIGATYGWRTAFVCAGAPGILLGLLALVTLREPRRGAFDPPTPASEEKPQNPRLMEIGGMMVSIPTIRFLTIAGVLSVFGVSGLSAFTASFFFRIHHLPLAKAGLVTGLIVGVAYTFGAVGGGFLADAKTRRSPAGGCYLVATTTLLAAPCAVAGFLAPSLSASIALIFIFKVLVGAFYGATFAGITRAAPVAARGAMLTFVTLFFNLCGAGGGPQLAGVLSDLFSAAGYADPLKWALAAVSLVFLLSAVFYVLAARTIKASAAA